MKDTTPALVLGKIPVGEKGQVLKLWTRKYGPQAYIIQSVRNNKKGIRPATLIPLTFLNATVEHRKNGHLEKINEVEVSKVWRCVTTHHLRQAICLFSAEVLQKVLQEGDSSPMFFDDFIEMIESWDDLNANLSMAINEFLLLIWKHLGFGINSHQFFEGCVFDLREGVFTSRKPAHIDFLTSQSSLALCSWIEDKSFIVSKELRSQITDGLILGLKWHYPMLGTIHSLDVLKVVFL
tara:strand:+ start:98 stop:808 length:711 start_codon:yes stop_codon:yes gene_type:complete